jgi:hypothetical protein
MLEMLRSGEEGRIVFEVIRFRIDQTRVNDNHSLRALNGLLRGRCPCVEIFLAASSIFLVLTFSIPPHNSKPCFIGSYRRPDTTA